MLENFHEVREIARIAMFEKDMTIQQLADDMGIARETLSRHISKKTPITARIKFREQILNKYGNEISRFVIRYGKIYLKWHDQQSSSKVPDVVPDSPHYQTDEDLRVIEAAVKRIRERQRAEQDAIVNKESLRLEKGTVTVENKHGKD